MSRTIVLTAFGKHSQVQFISHMVSMQADEINNIVEY